MKIINVDDKPYEWTYGGEIFGPLAPGQVADYPDTVAQHAIKRGVVLNDEGDFVRFRIEALDAVGRDKIKEIAMYECPFALTNQCDAKPFKSANDLKAHLESHWELSPEPAAAPRPPIAAPVTQAARK